jgi:DeoR family fructose operon transcriptional repressor
MSMYPHERHQSILERARAAGRVDVGTLAAELEVTAETIRRDLTTLERHGVLRRVHGGAIPVERLGFEPGLATRAGVLTAEKERMAKAALRYVPNEGTVLLDAGTSTAALADTFPTDHRLTVVTNALPIAMTLSARPNVTLMLLGGRVRGHTLAGVEDWALRNLAECFVDVAFLGANGVSVERGLTTPDPSEAATKRAMIGAARQVVVLADHTKIATDHFARFGRLEDVDVLITDSGADPELAGQIEAAGPAVMCA